MTPSSRPPAPRPPPRTGPLPAGAASFRVPDELHARPLDGVVRALTGASWSEARGFIETGKIRVAGEVVTETTRKVRKGDRVDLDPRAPRPKVAQAKELEKELLVHADASVVVVNKPAGISTVAFDEEEARGSVTLDTLVRDLLTKRDARAGRSGSGSGRRAPLGVVQRLDKATSGLLVFARTVAAKKHLGHQLREHTVHRVYLAIAHGDVRATTMRSHLVADRGDGLRGSADDEGRLAITHVTPVERLKGATLCACRLETGRTHQIRIHLSEAGHPLVGERVYVRRYAGPVIPAPRLMLHAAELGFEHPGDGRPMLFKQAPPADFLEVLARLR